VPRDLAGENAAMRHRLRDTEARLRLLASVVAAGDTHAAQAIARVVLTGTLDPDGVSQRPPSISTPASQVPGPHTQDRNHP
jgi:hypothetical protein